MADLTPERDEILEQVVREQLQDLGHDDESISEAISVMKDQGMFDVPER